jgi:hypothetical protein
MRRLTGLVLALLLAVLGTPASAAPAGELVFVANGSASGVLTLPYALPMDFAGFAMTTKSAYAALVITQDAALAIGMAFFQENGGESAMASNDTFPAGRSTVRVLAKGPVTLRFRIAGWAGRKVVRLTGPIAGATAVVRGVSTASSHTTDDIPFETAGPAFVVHRLSYTDGSMLKAEAFCAAPEPIRCDVPTHVEGDYRGWYGEEWQMYSPWTSTGKAHAFLRSVHLTDGPDLTLRHWLLAVPIS